MNQHHTIKTFPYFCPPFQQQKFSIHPQTKVSLQELWDPEPHAKGPGRSHPLVYWVIGRQTSVIVVEAIGDCEPVLAPLGYGLRVPAEHWLGCSGQKSLCGSSGFQKSPSTPLEKKTTNKKVWMNWSS